LTAWAGLFAAARGEQSPEPIHPNVVALARRAWAVTDLVLAHHLAPPTRLDMLTRLTGPLLRHTDPPADLHDRLARVANAEQLAAVLWDVWPEAGVIVDGMLQEMLPKDLLDQLPFVVEQLQDALLPELSPLRPRPDIRLPSGGYDNDCAINNNDGKVQELLIFFACQELKILTCVTLASRRKPRASGAEFSIPIATLQLRWV